jgi:hypothetical protein
MIIEEILALLGVPGSIVLVLSVLFAIYHGKNILDFFSRMTIWFRIGAVVAILSVLAIAGFIPGVDLTVHAHTLIDALVGVGEALWSLVRGFI